MLQKQSKACSVACACHNSCYELADDMAGSSGNHDRLCTPPEDIRYSKIVEEDTANDELVYDWSASSPLSCS